MILAANRPGSLRTVALRPHLIWGPGDPHLVPRIIERAKRGKLRLVGRGENLVDATYIDNAALAHILAADRLMNDDKPKCAGKAYFIANGEPLPMRELINRILAAAGLPAVKRRVPPRLAFAVGSLMETLKRNDSPKEPLMTRFVARQLATSHWYLLGAARRDLGYKPQVNLEEGMQRLAGWLQGQVESTTPASP
jgi:nucleoside-diphosphate-sugar epimerase